MSRGMLGPNRAGSGIAGVRASPLLPPGFAPSKSQTDALLNPGAEGEIPAFPDLLDTQLLHALQGGSLS